MNKHRPWLLSSLAASLVLVACNLAACNNEPPQRPTHEELMEKKLEGRPPPGDKAENRVEMPEETLEAIVEDTVPREIIDAVAADAAGRLSASPDAVRVISATHETWPSGAMGCPVPGEFYTMAVTRGYRIVVAVGGRQFDYRAGENGHFRLCEPGKPSPKR